MKTSSSMLLSLAASVLSAPTDYPAPAGGWESVDYPAGTGANLPFYPPPPGGWESIKYPEGTGANVNVNIPNGQAYTSYYTVVATPDQVIATNQTPAPGQADAVGIFNFGINRDTDTICYDIFLINVRGDYSSPARTATHIHQAAKGAAGPPRIAFPNPAGLGPFRQSSGCLTGPFRTGINGTDGVTDTGVGFKVSQIEDNPSGFFCDSHTVNFTAGVVRGQLA